MQQLQFILKMPSIADFHYSFRNTAAAAATRATTITTLNLPKITKIQTMNKFTNRGLWLVRKY